MLMRFILSINQILTWIYWATVRYRKFCMWQKSVDVLLNANFKKEAPVTQVLNQTSSEHKNSSLEITIEKSQSIFRNLTIWNTVLKNKSSDYFWLVSMKCFHFILDIDECTSKIDKCDRNAFCRNTIGSYTCTCKFMFAGDGFSCT